MNDNSYFKQCIEVINNILLGELTDEYKIKLLDEVKKNLDNNIELMNIIDSLIDILKNKKVDSRIELHDNMFNIFQIMYKYINSEASFEKIKESFLDEDTRNNIIMQSFGEENLKMFAYYYYLYDTKVAGIIEKDFEKIKKYEDAYKRIESNSFIIGDIDTYFECLKEAFENYKNKKLDVKFKFYSKEMRNSIHSVKNKNGERVEMDVNLSIPDKKSLHLMAIPRIFSKLYTEYKKEYLNNKNKFDVIEYMEFVCKIVPKYIKKILNNDISGNKKDVRILEKCKIDKDDFRKMISKSFEKIINFRKTYEYKYIPEIVVDYEINDNTRENKQGKFFENNDNTKKNKQEKFFEIKKHRFGLFTSAFTSEKDLTEFKDKIIKIDESKYEVIDDSISDDDKQILCDIVKQIRTTDIKVKFDKNGLVKTDGKVVFKVYTDIPTITGYSNEDAQYVQYNYYIDSRKILSDLPPSIFLLSYDKNDLDEEVLKDKKFVCNSVLTLARMVAFEIRDFNKEYNMNETKLKYLRNVLQDTNLFYDRLSKKINNSKLDEDFFVSLVEYYLYYEKEIKINEIEKYREYINEDLLKRLSFHIKSYFIDDFASKHFRKVFELSTYNERKSINEEEFDKAIPLNVIMNLTQKMRDETQKDPDIVSKPIGMVGFGVMRKNVPDVIDNDEDTMIEKYPKTFMGKTSLQLLMDLRINGWAYKLDTIYNDDGKLIIYNLNPISENKKLKKSLKECLMGKNNDKDNEDELYYDGPKKGR